MYQVIARKYRPQTFAELVGQGPVRTTLENAIAQRRIAHGYIFAGQRGTGKTTVARIMARCLNCVEGPTASPCGQCSSCLEIAKGSSIDVIEIDAASNRGINEMRELREAVRFRPARDRYKVFIIDEAHQITNDAFNALLKTLEEPPEWVCFILCTTEAHKLPTTIASRCQQFSFRSVDFGELVSRMTWICAQEGITADPGALAVLAQVGEGSVRDSLSALDQAIASCGNTLREAEVRDLLGLFSLDTMGQVAAALESGDSRAMLELVQELERNGRNLQHFCREVARFFRNLLVVRVTGPGTPLIGAPLAEQQRLHETAQRFSETDLTRYLKLSLEVFQELQYSLQPRFHIEIGLLRLIHAARLVDVEQALRNLGPAPAPAIRPPSVPPPATAPAASKPASAATASTAAPASATGSFRDRLIAQLLANGKKTTAAGMDDIEVRETPEGITFVGPENMGYTLKSADFQKTVWQVAGRTVKISVEIGAAAKPAAAAAPPAEANGGVQSRVLANPEVQRFQQLFPESKIKNVEDLSNL